MNELLFALFWTLSAADSFRIYQDAVPVATVLNIAVPAADTLAVISLPDGVADASGYCRIRLNGYSIRLGGPRRVSVQLPAVEGRHEYRVSAIQRGLESGLSAPVTLEYHDWTDGAYTVSDTLMQRGDDYLLLNLPASKWAITWGETVTALCLYDYDLSGRVDLSDLAVFGDTPWTLRDLAMIGEVYQMESIRRSGE